MKILISGGHLTPAVSFIEYVQQFTSDEVVFVGRKYSQKGNRQLSIEKSEIKKYKVKFLSIDAVGAVNQGLFHTCVSCWYFIVSFFQSLKIFFSEKPQVFVSFGGFVAVPLAVVAKLTRTPIVTHEQTTVSGLSSQFVGKIANIIGVSFASSKKWFNPKKTKVIGNLLRSGVFRQNHLKPSWFFNNSSLPTLLILGGSQGSVLINQSLKAILPELLEKWQVVHQVGTPSQKHNWLRELSEYRSQLSEKQRNNYFVQPFIDQQDLFWLYQHSQLAISRSGANTVWELAASKLPAILIPLPFAFRNEQLMNARWLKESGGAELLEQKDLSPETLLSLIGQTYTKSSQLKKSLELVEVSDQAPQRLYQLVQSVVNEKD